MEIVLPIGLVHAPEGRILKIILSDDAPLEYETLARMYGFRSLGQVFNALVTAKRMFKRHLREVIAQYAIEDAEANQELEALRRRLELRTRPMNRARSCPPVQLRVPRKRRLTRHRA